MNAGRTIFSQVMDFLPQPDFRRCVARYQGPSPAFPDCHILFQIPQPVAPLLDVDHMDPVKEAIMVFRPAPAW